MSENYCLLHWEREHVTVRRVATESRSKDTVVMIELSVSDSYTLGSLLQSLEEAKRRPAPEPKRRPRAKEQPERLALPAPALQLTYRGDDL